jgi:hypothetical protein
MVHTKGRVHALGDRHRIAFWKLAICPLKPSLSPFSSRRERHEEDDKNVAHSTEIKISFGNEVCADQTYQG